jgi:hypothetical protein
MEPAGGIRVAGRSHALGDGGRKSNDVVPNLSLDFLDSGDVEAGVTAQLTRGILRDVANLGERFGRGKLHFQPLTILVLFAPDSAHLGSCVARDHSVAKDLGRFLGMGHHQAREERAAAAVERASRDVTHDLGMIVMFAQMPENERANG